MSKIVKGFPFVGLYAITDTTLHGDGIATQVERAIVGGARVIQYRDKSTDTSRREREAATVSSVCHAYGVPLLINDDVDLALKVQAHGVHIGQRDTSLATARQRLGRTAIIGVSCYNRIELAEQARTGGADYVAFGRFFSSASKPRAVQAHPGLLSEARGAIDCPLVAIGGITAQNGRPLIDAGADMLAVIRGVFSANDVTAAAHEISELFKEDPEYNA